MYVYIYIYIYICRERDVYIYIYIYVAIMWLPGKRDFIHHHLLEAETATVPELGQKASMHHPLWVVVV